MNSTLLHLFLLLAPLDSYHPGNQGPSPSESTLPSTWIISSHLVDCLYYFLFGVIMLIKIAILIRIFRSQWSGVIPWFMIVTHLLFPNFAIGKMIFSVMFSVELKIISLWVGIGLLVLTDFDDRT